MQTYAKFAILAVRLLTFFRSVTEVVFLGYRRVLVRFMKSTLPVSEIWLFYCTFAGESKSTTNPYYNSIMTAKRLESLFILFLLLLLTNSCQRKDMSLKLNEPRNIRGVVSYKRTFGDLNENHLKAARGIGVAAVASRQEAEKMKKKLVHIVSNDYYSVDSLTHSIPFLVPRADKLLTSIGKNFMDSLQAKGLNPYQVVVTSVLRTREDVKKLRKRNVNATENSAHFYGTTFDVSWKRFQKVEDKNGRPLEDVRSDTLKLVLAEVLRDVRKAEKCYVKYELKQGCFHITAR